MLKKIIFDLVETTESYEVFESVGIECDYENILSFKPIITKCYIISNNLKGIFESNETEIDDILLNIYSPYTYVNVNYNYIDEFGTNNNTEATLIGFNKEYFNRFCGIIGHSGFMSIPGNLDYNIKSSEENEVQIQNNLQLKPVILRRQNASSYIIVDIKNKNDLFELFNSINPLKYSDEEIVEIINNFNVWDRVKFLLLAANKIDQNNLLKSVPHDIIYLIAEYL